MTWRELWYYAWMVLRSRYYVHRVCGTCSDVLEARSHGYDGRPIWTCPTCEDLPRAPPARQSLVPHWRLLNIRPGDITYVSAKDDFPIT